jgi:alkanesulfonate monooxygenase SsuD/methylene tetrahydromethanopterin reductase-like flavin-dependent oxidoreductase (luciferase family)
VSRWGNGFIVGGGNPQMAQQGYSLAEQAWRNAGRPGKPRFVACTYYGLGPNAAEQAAAYIRTYYAFMGPRAEQVASSLPSTPEALRETIKAFADIGVDELICWPCIPDLEQVDRLADIVSAQ